MGLLAIVALMGMMPVVGKDIEIFSEIEQASLSKILSKKTIREAIDN